MTPSQLQFLFSAQTPRAPHFGFRVLPRHSLRAHLVSTAAAPLARCLRGGREGGLATNKNEAAEKSGGGLLATPDTPTASCLVPGKNAVYYMVAQGLSARGWAGSCCCSSCRVVCHAYPSYPHLTERGHASAGRTGGTGCRARAAATRHRRRCCCLCALRGHLSGRGVRSSAAGVPEFQGPGPGRKR